MRIKQYRHIKQFKYEQKTDKVNFIDKCQLFSLR